VLGLWLCGITLYFIVSKTKSIKIIPASLCLIAFLITVGPWSVFNISIKSQLQRLEKLLVTNSILIDGKITKSKSEIPFDDAKEISSVVRYIYEVHGISTLQPWFNEPLNCIQEIKTNGHRDIRGQSSAILNLIGVQPIENWQMSPDSLYRFSIREDEMGLLKLNGYQVLLSFNINMQHPFHDVLHDGNIIYYIHTNITNSIFYIETQEYFKIIRDSISVDFTPFTQSLISKYNSTGFHEQIPRDDMTYMISSNNMNLKFIFDDIQFKNDNNQFDIKSARGKLFVGYSETGIRR
jgi:hypothetical protein